MRVQGTSLFALTCLLSISRYQISARGPIQDAIQNGQAAEYVRENCTWRNENDHSCPDPSIQIHLYKFGKEKINLQYGLNESREWLNNDLYDRSLDNVILIHGYNGGDGALPMVILRDVYIRNGSYNVFVVDWGALGASPCYPAAVTNLRFVANCLSHVLMTLKNLGMYFSRTTCVGHSLGAHLCGLISNYIPFRFHHIIGLDPAKPLIRPGKGNRLDSGDAEFVQVLHTNAGYYGESSREGHVDFCANGGKLQPFCENAERNQLCSHNWSICYMADSIDGRSELFAEPCSGRCPPPRRVGPRSSESLIIGHQTPTTIRGSYCLTTVESPYCPRDKLDRGDIRCCV